MLLLGEYNDSVALGHKQIIELSLLPNNQPLLDDNYAELQLLQILASHCNSIELYHPPHPTKNEEFVEGACQVLFVLDFSVDFKVTTNQEDGSV